MYPETIADQVTCFGEDGSKISLTDFLNDHSEEIDRNAESLDTHLNNKNNPHGVSVTQIGAVPTSRTVNGKGLTSNVTLSAADVSAVPTTRTINGKALSANISLTASDVGADSSGSSAAVQANLTAHTVSKSNPHGVTTTQVGIGYGTSNNTATATALTATTTEPGFVRNKGSVVGVVFANTRTTNNAATFNYAGSGAAPLYDVRTNTTPVRGSIKAGITHYILYNGDDWILLNPYAPASVYGTCATAAGTTAKVGVIPDGYSLSNGSAVGILFANANTASSPTLNVDGSGAMPIQDCRTGTYPVAGAIGADMTHYFLNNGGAWVLLNPYMGIDQAFYGTCTTAAGTVGKSVAITGFSKIPGAVAIIHFSNYNYATDPTLNISSSGASPLLYRGKRFKYGVIDNNTTIKVMFDGENYNIIEIIQDKKDRQNLVDNWDFRKEPVNQRGETLYSAGVKFTVDRWKQTAGMTTEVVPYNYATDEEGYLYCKSTSTGTQYIEQKIDRPLRFSAGGKFTVTIIYKATVARRIHIVRNGTTGSTYASLPATGDEWDIVRYQVSLSSPISTLHARVTLNSSSTVFGDMCIKAVKLETGDTSTLVLDDYADHDEELRKCQRFFWRMSTQYDLVIGLAQATSTELAETTITSPVPMSVPPWASGSTSTGTLILKQGNSNEYVITNMGSLQFKGDGNSTILNALLASTGLSPGTIYRVVAKAGTSIDISCEL